MSIDLGPGLKHYKIIGTDVRGALTTEVETFEPIAPPAFRSALGDFGYEFGGFEDSPSLREELLGEPKIKGLCGPMYDGETDGVPCIRYETLDAYRILSA